MPLRALGWLTGLLLSVLSGSLFADTRPNVLVIYSDDQGTFDAHCLGSRDLVTPALDKLAATGVTFSHMYAPSAVCSASRAGLMTGRYPVAAGVPGNVSSTQGEKGMPSEQLTIAEVFQQAGYATGHIGKWHLGYTPETMPNAQGFDVSFGHMGGCIDNYSHFFYWDGPNRHDLWKNGQMIWRDGEYFPDLMVQECKSFIDQHADRPFFVYFAMNIPHYPLQGTAKWREVYQHLESPRREYAACLSTMDEKVRELLEHLESKGLRENTIVLFQSDHGHSTELRTFQGGGNSGNLRGAKFSLFEGGIRVPAFVSWPAKLEQGVVRDQLATGCDWLPTLCELCEISIPAVTLHGRSQKEVLLQNASGPHAELFWKLGNGEKAQVALRQGPWKLVLNPVDSSGKAPITPEDAVFLCNLDKDPEEMHNLRTAEPDRAERMKQRIAEISAELGQVPANRGK